jgi:hypothetical protein
VTVFVRGSNKMVSVTLIVGRVHVQRAPPRCFGETGARATCLRQSDVVKEDVHASMSSVPELSPDSFHPVRSAFLRPLGAPDLCTPMGESACRCAENNGRWPWPLRHSLGQVGSLET